MDPLICKVEQGTLKGQKDNDLDGKSFLSFMGIPYAKPPVGQLRFKNPQPPENWDGIRDATKVGNCCYFEQNLPSPEGLNLKRVGSEDCLFLNVYTPKLPQSDRDDLKPVMVFIHGGAFTVGSGDRTMYGPEFLMTEDIVLVTINYRVGALGFLVIDDPSLGVTGNAGLKDQVQALKWVKKNIKYFGGNPDNVTIFGESAGGASVQYLLLSPLAKDLFHKAIIQSGSVLCPWARGENNAQQLAQVLGCTETDDKKILDFLLQIPVEKILDGQNKLGDWLFCIEKRHFGPSIESKTEGAFLCEEPLKLLESGNYNKVPLMIGYTSREGLLEEGIGGFFNIETNRDEFVPYYFGYKRSSIIYKEINKKISKFYFDSEKPDPNNKDGLHLVVTDVLFLRSTYLSVKAHAQTLGNPVYYYRMSLDTELNFLKNMMQLKAKGACHGDDIGYLFKIENSKDLKPGSPEEIGLRRFVKMWTNFAKTGNPIPIKDSLLNAEWKPVTPNEINFLDIGTELVPGTQPDIDRMNFWDEISKGIQEYY